MTAFEKYFGSIRGKSITVIGAGISNIPLIRLLCLYGAKVTVRDRQEKLSDENALLLAELGTETVLGGEYLEALEDEYIFRTPGLLPTDPHLVAAELRGSVITSEMELFYELCPALKIGITGSDGKTTTSTLIAKMLEASGKKVFLGGNIGTPLLDRIPQMQPEDFAVTELSSFQLMDMKCSPEIAVVTNLSPNHLDKHSGMAEYIDAKRNIYLHQDADGLLVTNLENETTRGFYADTKGKRLGFSSKRSKLCGIVLCEGAIVRRFPDGSDARLIDTEEIILPGNHNIENYMAAAGAVYGYVRTEDMRAVARGFGGVEHRCEFVRELNGVKYYNSSIDSSPTRTIAALSAFDRKLIVIAGGYDKHIPFDALGQPITEKVKLLILAGATSEKIAAAVRSAPGYTEGNPEIKFVRDLRDAVEAAHNAARSGDIVILSPACASFDAFKNFEERGKAFKNAVSALK